MENTSLLARSGLWRVTRHDFVRTVYHRLETAGVFLAQLDRFEMETTDEAGCPPPVDVSGVTITVERLTETYPDRLRNAPVAPSDDIVVARRDGERIGSCCLSNRAVYVPELHRRLAFPGRYLWRLYVNPTERGRGVGSALVREAIAQTTSEPGLDSLTALVAPDNLPSRRAFHNQGFEARERFTSLGVAGREWHRRRPLQP
jgi:RimJ/RimL family protein N-acetyltransferase